MKKYVSPSAEILTFSSAEDISADVDVLSSGVRQGPDDPIDD